MKVTVLMPVYNRERYLAEAINSILAQTFQDFEFLIIDDGSTDNSVNIIRTYSDSRIKLIIHEHNQGLITTLNEGIQLANAEYIARMDSDDISVSMRLQQQYNYLMVHTQAVAVGCDFAAIDLTGNVLYQQATPHGDMAIKRSLAVYNPLAHGSMMFRKTAVQAVGGYKEQAYLVEDYDLWARLATIGELASLPVNLYSWRVNPQGESVSKSNQQHSKAKEIQHRIWESFGEVGPAPYRVWSEIWNKTDKSDSDFFVQLHLLFAKAYCQQHKFIEFLQHVMVVLLVKPSFFVRYLFKKIQFLRTKRKNINKKILIVTPRYFPSFGGLEEVARTTAQELLKQGYQVEIVTEKQAPQQLNQEVIDNIKVYRLGYFPRGASLQLLRLAIKLVGFVLMHRKKYQGIIIRTLTWYAICFGILKWLKLLKIKTFVSAEVGGQDSEFNTIKHSRFKKIIVWLLNHNDYLNSICSENYQHYQQLGFTKNKLTQINNGIDITPYKTSHYPNTINNFLFIGRLVKTKGLYELLEAFKQLLDKYPNKKLYIGGDGEERSYIKKFIQQHNLTNNIIYQGYIDNKNKAKFFSQADCLVLPSYFEANPMAVIEATVYKKLIISTDVSDIKAMYRNNIIYCEPKSVTSLYQAMVKVVIEYNPTTLNYDHFIAQIDIRNTIKQMLNLFSVKIKI